MLFRILRNSGLTGEGILAIFPFNSKFFDVPPDAVQKCQRLRLKETIFNFDYMNRVNKTNLKYMIL